jgi:thioesterase domain-containing protein
LFAKAASLTAAPVLVTLRDGTGDACVFLFPGAGGDARELAALAAALTDPAPKVGVQTALASPSPQTVEEMAVLALAAMRERQPHGPYRLVGYSFGGLVAMEVARLCRSIGEPVATLAFIDTIFDRRYWPTALFLSAQLDRVGVHLRLMASSSPRAALAQLKDRAKGLWRRLAERHPGVAASAKAVQGQSAARRICDAAMAAYRPTPYLGAVCLLQSGLGQDFGCEPAALWRSLAEHLVIRAIPGRHLDLVRAPAALATLAAALDAALAPERSGPRAVDDGARRPKALLVTSRNWLPTARLAVALTEAGFDVEAVCPPGHSLGKAVPAVRRHRYRPLAAQRSLRAAIDAADPQIVIPCDDPVTAQLHRLAMTDRTPTSTYSGLIARSLGAPEMFDRLYGRNDTMELALEAGVRRPETASVDDHGGLLAWLDRHGYPAVIKSDGSWGGNGVVLVHDAAQAVRAFDRLRAPPAALRVAKRLLVDREADLVGPWLRRRRAAVSVQAFIPGPSANAAVACSEGEVLAVVCAEVVRTQSATGPATVVRIVEHPEMVEAVTRMVRKLRLSGLCGFDFVMGPQGAYLIELNPRATPTCHLTSADGLNPVSALLAAVQERPAPVPEPGNGGGLVALFPQEMTRDAQSPFLETARHDVPWRWPELVAEGLRSARHGQAGPRSPGRRGAEEAWATLG